MAAVMAAATATVVTERKTAQVTVATETEPATVEEMETATGWTTAEETEKAMGTETAAEGRTPRSATRMV